MKQRLVPSFEHPWTIQDDDDNAFVSLNDYVLVTQSKLPWQDAGLNYRSGYVGGQGTRTTAHHSSSEMPSSLLQTIVYNVDPYRTDRR